MKTQLRFVALLLVCSVFLAFSSCMREPGEIVIPESPASDAGKEITVRRGQYPVGTMFQSTKVGLMSGTLMDSDPSLIDRLDAPALAELTGEYYAESGVPLDQFGQNITLTFNNKDYDVTLVRGDKNTFRYEYSTADKNNRFVMYGYDGNIQSAYLNNDNAGEVTASLDEVTQTARRMLEEIAGVDYRMCTEEASEEPSGFLIDYCLNVCGLPTTDSFSFTFTKSGELRHFGRYDHGFFSPEKLASAGVDLSDVDIEKITDQFVSRLSEKYEGTWSLDGYRLIYFGDNVYAISLDIVCQKKTSDGIAFVCYWIV